MSAENRVRHGFYKNTALARGRNPDYWHSSPGATTFKQIGQ